MSPIPYVGPVRRSSAGSNLPIHRIVIHSAVAPCEPGTARMIGEWFKDERARGSAHAGTDPAETIQYAKDNVICWHAPPNRNSLGVEMADMPSSRDMRRWFGGKTWDQIKREHGRPARFRLRLLSPNYRAMLRRTAVWTADKALEHDVPMVWLSPRALRAGRRGITSHANVSKAFGQSTHWDPGRWPRRTFMRYARKRYRVQKAKRDRMGA